MTDFLPPPGPLTDEEYEWLQEQAVSCPRHSTRDFYSSLLDFYHETGFLTVKQLAVVRERMAE